MRRSIKKKMIISLTPPRGGPTSEGGAVPSACTTQLGFTPKAPAPSAWQIMKDSQTGESSYLKLQLCCIHFFFFNFEKISNLWNPRFPRYPDSQAMHWAASSFGHTVSQAPNVPLSPQG